MSLRYRGKQMKVFITGGTGFAGPVVSEKIKSSGASVTLLERNKKKIPHLKELGFEVFEGTLEEKDADLFKYIDGLIGTLNATIEKSSLFDQFSDARREGAPENFTEAVETELTKNFGGDRSKYSDAMNKVAAERPDLYAAYKHNVPAGKEA